MVKDILIDTCGKVDICDGKCIVAYGNEVITKAGFSHSGDQGRCSDRRIDTVQLDKIKPSSK